METGVTRFWAMSATFQSVVFEVTLCSCLANHVSILMPTTNLPLLYPICVAMYLQCNRIICKSWFYKVPHSNLFLGVGTCIFFAALRFSLLCVWLSTMFQSIRCVVVATTTSLPTTPLTKTLFQSISSGLVATATSLPTHHSIPHSNLLAVVLVPRQPHCPPITVYHIPIYFSSWFHLPSCKSQNPIYFICQMVFGWPCLSSSIVHLNLVIPSSC